MSRKTTYAGIDYSGSSGVNRDTTTGIRYGVISQHSLNGDALTEVFQNGRDLSYENFMAQVKSELRSALSDYISDYKYGDRKISKLDDAVENAFDSISDELNDGYTNDGDSSYLYESDGYSIQTCLDSDLMITKSEFFTYAQFCSPCVPGACNLDSPLDRAVRSPDENQCFCLGHDWFGDGKAPYLVFSVATGQQIQPEGKPCADNAFAVRASKY